MEGSIALRLLAFVIVVAVVVETDDDETDTADISTCSGVATTVNVVAEGLLLLLFGMTTFGARIV